MKGTKTGGRKAGTPNKANADLREAAQQFTADALQTKYPKQCERG